MWQTAHIRRGQRCPAEDANCHNMKGDMLAGGMGCIERNRLTVDGGRREAIRLAQRGTSDQGRMCTAEEGREISLEEEAEIGG